MVQVDGEEVEEALTACRGHGVAGVVPKRFVGAHLMINKSVLYVSVQAFVPEERHLLARRSRTPL